MDSDALEYVGFWPRVAASLIDSILLCLITIPLLLAVYGFDIWSSEKLVKGPADVFISWILPAILYIGCWARWQATPGKMALSARIVDATTGGNPTIGQCIGRYVGLIVGSLLLIGVIWVAFDPRKQGLHDKLAGTVVVRPRNREPAAVRFEGARDR